MAAGAFEGKTQEGCPKGMDAVSNIFDAEFLRDASSLDFLRMQAVEAGGEDLVLGCVGKKVPGNLLGDELVVGKVLSKSLDNPVAPGPDMTIAVLLVCLLYTSPSPRDATLSRMPSSA